MKVLVLSFLMSFVCSNGVPVSHQVEEKLEDRSLLGECLEEVRVSYSNKDKEPFLEVVKNYSSVANKTN